MCSSAAIDSSEAVDAAELRRTLPKMLTLARSDGFRAKPALLALIGSVVAADGGGVVNGPGMVASVVSCAVELLSHDDWAARKAAAVLEQFAVEVGQRHLVVEVKTLCLNALEKRRFDKVKIAREAMNRALEAWKAVNEMSLEDSPLSHSKSSSSKDDNNGIYSSPESSDHQNFGFEPPELKKNRINSRSSLSDCSTVTGPPPTFHSSGDASSETPQLKKSMSNSRSSSVSSLSDDSTIAVAKKESLQIASRKKSHLRKSDARKPLDWKVAEDTPSTTSAGVGFEQRNSESVDMVENSSGVIGSST